MPAIGFAGLARPGGAREVDETEDGARPVPRRAASRRDTHQTAGAVLAVIGLGAPVVVYLAFIHHYALNVVARDEWSDVSTVWLSRHGKMGLDQLWTPWSVERMFFPRLIVMVLGRTTNLNTVTEMYLSAALLLGATALMVAAHRRRRPGLPLYLYAPVAVVMLSLVQQEDTLWGFQVAWYLILFCLVAVLLLLDRDHVRWSRLAVAAVLAVVASYSSFQGLLVWPAALFLLALHRQSPRKLLSWAGAGGATTALYFAGLSSGTQPLYGLQHPLDGLRCFFFSLGDILGYPVALISSNPKPGVEVFGVLVFLLSVWVLVSVVRRPEPGPGPFAGALVCFGLLWTAALAVTQSAQGLASASQSRFTLYSLLVPVGCYLAMVGRRGGFSLETIPKLLVVGSMATVAVVGTVNGLHGGRTTYRSRIAEAVLTVNAKDATTAQIEAVDRQVGTRAQLGSSAAIARHQRLAMFATGLAARFEPLGLTSGIWVSSLRPHVTPWRQLHPGDLVTVRGDGFPRHVDVRIVQCTNAIVSSLSLDPLLETGRPTLSFSDSSTPTSCTHPLVARADPSSGRLAATYRVAGHCGRVCYVAVVRHDGKVVLASAEITWAPTRATSGTTVTPGKTKATP